MTRFYIPMTTEEFIKLTELAQRDCRHPRDQARYILRTVLLGDALTTDAVQVSEKSPPVCTPEPVFSP